MAENLILAIDAMGGDHAPQSVITGLNQVLKQTHDVHFLLFGDEAKVSPWLKKFPQVAAKSTFTHCSRTVSGEDKLAQVVRFMNDTSLFSAIRAVREGKAAAVISGGNTGVLMGLSKLALKTVPGIMRPAIVTQIPTDKKPVVVLDLGANLECDSTQLIDFAFMGATYAQMTLGVSHPKLALLNVGSEETKGDQTLQETHAFLRDTTNAPFEYTGFIEGDGLGKGLVDVIVTDGFTGNVMLKTVEGTSKIIMKFTKKELLHSIWGWIALFFLIPFLLKLYKKLNPNRYNGAIFLGLQGIVVKSHGGANAFGFATAVLYALQLVEKDFVAALTQNLALRLEAPAAPGVI